MGKISIIFRKTVIFLIKVYRYYVSPFLGNNCRFHPNCSLYAQTAIEKHGLIVGILIFLKRLIKCHPFYKGDYNDPVP